MNTFIAAMQRYVANVGISGSSLRNQGAPGVIKNARKFLSSLDLSALKCRTPDEYEEWLDQTTEDLMQALPPGGNHWGAARKAINIFMAHAAFNRILTAQFGLEHFADVMETPLDSFSASELRSKVGGEQLPKWPGVSGLKKEISGKYQVFATQIAKQKQIPRGCLDVILWRPVETVTPNDR